VIADASLGAGFYDEWDPGDPREQYTAVDRSTMFVPYDLVGIVRCPKCGDDYANAVFVKAHVARDHSAAAAPSARAARAPVRPVTVPEPVRPADVRPGVDLGASASLRPVPEPQEPERTVRPEARSGRYSHTRKGRHR
jgi:hypothetical protein